MSSSDSATFATTPGASVLSRPFRPIALQYPLDTQGANSSELRGIVRAFGHNRAPASIAGTHGAHPLCDSTVGARVSRRSSRRRSARCRTPPSTRSRLRFTLFRIQRLLWRRRGIAPTRWAAALCLPLEAARRLTLRWLLRLGRPQVPPAPPRPSTATSRRSRRPDAAVRPASRGTLRGGRPGPGSTPRPRASSR